MIAAESEAVLGGYSASPVFSRDSRDGGGHFSVVAGGHRDVGQCWGKAGCSLGWRCVSWVSE